MTSRRLLREKTGAVALCLLIAGAVTLSGCGNNFMPERTAPRGSYETHSAASTGTTDPDADYICPPEYEPNVKPDYDWDLDGTGYYRVCTNREAPANLKIHGRTSTSDVICVFPAKALGGSVKVWRDARGAAFSQCAQVSSAGAYVSLPVEMDPNAFFIVEGPDDAKMHLCLELGNITLCPHFSFGKLRPSPSDSSQTPPPAPQPQPSGTR